MRLLHTSDWHLGRSLHRGDLRAAHAAFVDHLVGTVRSESVDVVLVAGDVFDRAVPPVDAVRLYEEALLRLRDAGARVVLISGNHDSATRLGVNAGLLDQSGVHVRTRVERACAPVLLPGTGTGTVAVYGIPYLEPAAVRSQLPPEPPADAPKDAPEDAPEDAPGSEPRGHAGVLGRVLRGIHADLRGRPGARSVVLAHGWVSGGQGSDSERDISVGGVGSVPTRLFDGLSYVALGHLHGAQVLADHLRYSGSPLAFSFSEAAHVKGSWLVELTERGVAAHFVEAPVPRRLSVVSGRLDELLADPALRDREGDWLSVVLTDASRPEAAMERLRARFPEVLALAWEPAGRPEAARSYAALLRGRSDLEVAEGFVGHVRDEPTPAERELLREAIEAVRVAASEGPVAGAAPGSPADAQAPVPAGIAGATEAEVA